MSTTRIELNNNLFMYTVHNGYNKTDGWIIKSSPNSNGDAYISKEDLVSYAALLTGLFNKHNINAQFEVKFCGMDGWMVMARITNEDALALKLKAEDFEECQDEIQEFLAELYVYETEDEE